MCTFFKDSNLQKKGQRTILEMKTITYIVVSTYLVLITFVQSDIMQWKYILLQQYSLVFDFLFITNLLRIRNFCMLEIESTHLKHFSMQKLFRWLILKDHLKCTYLHATIITRNKFINHSKHEVKLHLAIQVVLLA